MKLGEFIKKYREDNNLTMEDFAKRANLTKGYISMLEKNQNPKTKREIVPSFTTIQQIANAMSLSVSDIIAALDDKQLISWEKEPPQVKKGIKIPVLGSVRAGVPEEATQEVLEWEEISEDMLSQGEHFGLMVKGSSMEPKFSEGDVVIVRKQSTAETGDVVIALINGDEATIKKLKKMENGIMLVPANPNFEAMYYTNEEIEKTPVRIIGKVVELRAKFN